MRSAFPAKTHRSTHRFLNIHSPDQTCCRNRTVEVETLRTTLADPQNFPKQRQVASNSQDFCPKNLIGI
eukprot:g63744.t1